MKALSQLNAFFRLATERKLSGSDQLMYLHILWKFNESHWTETLRIKDAELKECMRLYDTTGKPASLEVLRRGRQRLKAKGFLDYKSGGGQEPEYRLLQLYPADTPADSPAYTPADSGAASHKHVREDVKTPDNDSMDGASACELDEVVDYWERDLRGGVLSFEHQSQIAVYLSQKGAPWLRAIMAEASAANGNNRGLTPKFLFAVIARKLAAEKPAPKSGSKRSAAELTAATLQKAANSASSESLTHAASQWT